MAEAKTLKIHCNQCAGKTNHIHCGEHIATNRWGRPDEGFFDTITAALYICAGCESPTMMITEFGNYLPEDYEPIPEYYPDRNIEFRARKQFQKLPKQLEGIYGETVRALNRESLLLCTIGMRTLLEGVCGDKGVKGKNLEEKIDNLGQFFP